MLKESNLVDVIEAIPDWARNPIRPTDCQTPSWITSEQETPAYLRAIAMMAQNREAAWKIEGLWPEMVLDIEALQAAETGPYHSFGPEDVGVVETLVFLDSEADELCYIQFEITGVPEPTAVTMELFGAGRLYRSPGEPYNPYWIDEYEVHKCAEITFASDHPMTPERNRIYNWGDDPEISKLGNLFLMVQKWVFA